MAESSREADVGIRGFNMRSQPKPECRKISAFSIAKTVKQSLPVQRKLSAPVKPFARTQLSPKVKRLVLENGNIVEKMRKQSLMTWRKLSVSQTGQNGSEDTDSYSWTQCQQIILRILHGEKVNADERTKAANSISDLTLESLAPLVTDFYKNQLLPQSMQDLLADVQEASTSKEKLGKVLEIWSIFFFSTLPDIISILYSLEQSDIRFSVKGTTLTAFRDLILIKTVPLCENFEALIKENCFAQKMLFILEFSTRNHKETREYENFVQLFSATCVPPVPIHKDSIHEPSVLKTTAKFYPRLSLAEPPEVSLNKSRKPKPSGAKPDIRPSHLTATRRHSMIPVIGEDTLYT